VVIDKTAGGTPLPANASANALLTAKKPLALKITVKTIKYATAPPSRKFYFCS